MKAKTPVVTRSGGITRWQWAYATGGLLLGLLAVYLAVTFLLPHRFAGTLMQSSQPAPDFSLAGSNGARVSLADFRGKVVLLFFGYTACPDVCPTTLYEVQKMYAALGKEGDGVQMLFVSVDPERDTAQRLDEYLSRYDARIIGLTGSLDEITDLATRYGVYFAKRLYGEQGQYTVDHTATLMLIDPQGYLKVLYPYGTPGSEIARDLKYLLR